MPRKRTPRVPRGKLEYVSAQLEVAMAALRAIAQDKDDLASLSAYRSFAHDALAQLESTTYGKREV